VKKSFKAFLRLSPEKRYFILIPKASPNQAFFSDFFIVLKEWHHFGAPSLK
jgi:hypothetical protein